MSSTLREDVAERAQRERQAWNGNLADNHRAFKARFGQSLNTPHRRLCEKRRTRVLEQRCADAVVLDYGCFDGCESQRYLDWGARRVVGVDISDEAIRVARERVPSERAEFVAGDAHALPFEAGTFDLVVGRAILHHLTLDVAYAEIRRVLKPGGLAAFVEPLRGNPGAKLIRFLTPDARTPDERPLDGRDIALGEKLIGPGPHEYSGFVSVPAALLSLSLRGLGEEAMGELAARADDRIGATPLRYWSRLAYLNFYAS